MIYVNGLFRSGTTVCFNICRQLHKQKFISNNIKKCHETWLQYDVKPTDFNIYTYRDLRTITASLMRKRRLDEYSFCQWANSQFNTRNFEEWFNFLLDYDQLFYQKMSEKNLSGLFLKYEDDILNIDSGIFKIIRYLHLLLPKYILDELANTHSIDNNLEITTKLRQGEEDPVTRYHYNHISKEYTDYRTYIPERYYADNERLNTWLKSKGYEK